VIVPRNLRLSLFAFTWLLLTPSKASGFLGELLHLPPNASYQQLQNERFSVVYPKEYEEEAKRTIVLLEEAHQKLAERFRYNRSDQVTVLLADTEDRANGVASAIGLQGLVLYLKAPEPYSPVGEYDDWLRMLVFHEYTHYLTLVQTRGLFSFLRVFLGHALLPNHAWPSWLSEGLAVWVESNYTRQGRGHGTYFNTITRDALARGDIDSDDFLGFDLISANPRPEFPFGDSAYYAGYGIVDELVKRNGPEALGTLVEEGSARIPYFLNGTLENVVEKHVGTVAINEWRGLWNAWTSRERDRLGSELEWLKQRPSSELVTRTHSTEGDSAIGARLSPNAELLAYSVQSGHHDYQLKLKNLRSGKVLLVLEGLSTPGVAFSEDSSKLYYSRLEYVGEHRVHADLYEFEIARAKHKRLTHGFRAKDPDLCGDKLVYATQKGRFSRLETFDLYSREHKIVYAAPAYTHVSNPRCDDSGEFVYFSQRAPGKLDLIRGLNLKANTLLPFSIGDGNEWGAIFPEPSSDGIYFTRVRDGFYEFARKKPQQEPETIARSKHGYWLPSVEKGTVALTLVTSRGLRAATVETKKIIAPAQLVPAVSAVWKPASPLNAATNPPVQNTTIGNYHLFSSLSPRIWSPVGEFSSSYWTAGVSLLGWDDLDQLRYSLTPWYDSFSKKPMGNASTRHRIGTFYLGLSAEREVTDRFSFASGLEFYSIDTTFGASLMRPWTWIEWQFTPTVVFERNQASFGGSFLHRTFEPDYRAGLDLRLSSIESFDFSIGPDEGFGAVLSGRKFWSSGDQPLKTYAQMRKIFSLWSQHTVLDTQIFGAIAHEASYDIPDSIIEVGGSGDSSRLDLPLRGYPSNALLGNRAAAVQFELRIPISQVFRGTDTFPMFNRNFGAFVFYDAAKVRETDDEWRGYSAGAGGGLVFNLTAFYHVPFNLKFQYARGLHRAHRGESAFNILIGGGLPF